VPDKNWGDEQFLQATEVRERLNKWIEAINQLNDVTSMLTWLSFEEPVRVAPMSEQLSKREPWWAVIARVDERASWATQHAIRAENAAHLYAGLLTAFVLPVLLGGIGAIAYVIRMISEQIRSFTFTRSSPIRHTMRATLGALAGFVVGLFSNLSSQINLPPLALAFLAGYGVEALFSMFDGFIAKFKAT